MSPTPVRMQATRVAGTPRAQLAEGPVWDARTAELLWVDIPAGVVHGYSPSSGQARVLASIGQTVGCVIPRRSGGWLLGTHTGIQALGEDASLTMLAPIEPDEPSIRVNDGKCDPAGRLWVGTLSMRAELGRAALYCLHPDGDLSLVLPGVSISNGLAWTRDASTMYFTDTMTSRVDAFDYAQRSGLISARRTHVQVPLEAGMPDGCCIDVEDCLWVALWNGSAVHRYSPARELLAVVEVAARNVSSVAFGGDDLATLYITTAVSEDPTAPEEDGAGRLYSLVPGVKGAPVAAFAG